ncbi:MAG: NUDIX domain-containing protein [Candidatus Dojkabacteria bacterium]
MKSYRAGGIVINKENKIALANEHLWGFPRGGVEDGEDFISAAKREVLEETGLDQFESIEELGIYERYPNDISKDTPGAYPMEIHMFLFKINEEQEFNPLDKNVKEVGWFTYEEALERLTNDEDREFLQEHRREVLEVRREIKNN